MKRKKFEPDLESAARLAAERPDQGEIAATMGSSEKTLARRPEGSADFAEIVERDPAAAEKEITNKLFELARAGNISAIIWIEKTRFGRTDKVSAEETGQVSVTVRYE